MRDVVVPLSSVGVVEPPAFSCALQTSDGLAYVTLTGELDVATAPLLGTTLRSASLRAPTVVVDLRRLEFMDCSGACLLLQGHRRLERAQQELVVVRGPRALNPVFHLAGLDRLLRIVDEPLTLVDVLPLPDRVVRTELGAVKNLAVPKAGAAQAPPQGDAPVAGA